MNIEKQKLGNMFDFHIWQNVILTLIDSKETPLFNTNQGNIAYHLFRIKFHIQTKNNYLIFALHDRLLH